MYKNNEVRKTTVALLEMASNMGDYYWLAESALLWMSEQDVSEMAHHYGWLENDYE